MQRLTGIDAAFLALETPSTHMHVMATMVLDPSDVPGGFTVESAELAMIPKTTIEVADESAAKKVLRLIDQLEENDDVQDVYANFDIPERVLETVA